MTQLDSRGTRPPLDPGPARSDEVGQRLLELTAMVVTGFDRFERWAAGDVSAGTDVNDVAASVEARRPSMGGTPGQSRPRWEQAVSRHLHRALGDVDEVVRDATRWRLDPDPVTARMAMLLCDAGRRVQRGLVSLAAGDPDRAGSEAAAVSAGRSTFEELHLRAAGGVLAGRDLIGVAVRIDQHDAMRRAFDEVVAAAERLALAGARSASRQPKRPET